MAEDSRHDADVTPAETASTETAPSSSGTVTVVQTPDTPPVSGSAVTVVQSPDIPVETHTQAQIDLDNLREREEVLPQESVPPADQQSDMPVDLQEVREASAQRPPVVDNERRYGPLSGSMWFLGIAVVAFVLALISRLL